MLADTMQRRDEGSKDRHSPNSYGSGKSGFLNADASDILPFVQSAYSEGIDYSRIFGNNKVLLLGDTDHRQHESLGGLESQLQGMKDSGVTNFAIEIDNSERYVDALIDFYVTGDLAHVRWIGEETRTPVRITRFFKTAYDAGINIHFIDKPEELREVGPEEDFEGSSFERGVYMGQSLAKIANQSQGKVVAFVGYAHLDPDQIPEQLDEADVGYSSVGMVSAGQPSPNPIISILMDMGATAAIAHEGLQERLGYVDMGGEYGLEGFVHFPKVKLVEGIENHSGVLKLGPVESSEQSSTALVSIDANTTLPSVLYDMRDNIEPSAYEWEDTNFTKIMRFVSEMDGLSGGQKLYLGIMLENYVRSSARHSGASIYNIEYDSDARAFGIDSIDTHGYEFKPEPKQYIDGLHREVTLEGLLRNFSFDDMVVSGIEDLPEINIRPNPENEESLYRLLVLASAYAANPDKVRVTSGNRRSEIRISSGKNNAFEDYFMKLDLRDFDFSDNETRLLEAIKPISHRSYGRFEDVIFGISQARDDAGHFRFRYKRDLQALIELFVGGGDTFMWNVHDFPRKVEKEILEARSRLEYMDDDTVLDVIAQGQATYQRILDKVDEIEALTQKHPDFENRTFRRLGDEFSMSSLIEGFREFSRQGIEDLDVFKRDLSDPNDEVII